MNEEHFPVFKLYINKEHKDISVTRDGEMFLIITQIQLIIEYLMFFIKH